MKIDTQYASNNYWDGNDPRSIMLHTTYGDSVIGAVEHLKSVGLSYNYIIKRGVIYELVPFNKSAWHAGKIARMNLRARAFYGTGLDDENPNRNSVGVAFAQPPGVDILPEEDVAACVELMKFIGSQSGYRYTPDNIFYHREVTNYKPIEVKKFRELVVDALVGDKDMKDAKEAARIELLRRVLIEIIRRKLSTRQA